MLTTQRPTLKRKIAEAYILGIATGVIAAAIAAGTYVRLAEPSTQLTTHVVLPGENIWKLKRHYAPEMSAWAWCYRVRQLNDMPTYMLQPGQKIRVLKSVPRR